MHKLFLLIISLSVAGLSAIAGSTAAHAASFSTPEAAIAAYVEGVAARDFDRVLAATAVAEMRDGFDFVAHIDRLQAIVPVMPAPGGDPLFDGLNAAQFTSQIAVQVKFLVYGLMATAEISGGKTTPMDAAGAAALVARLDTTRLGALRLEKVGVPNPAVLNSDRYVANAEKRARTLGADEATERIALLAFEGASFVIGFSLLRYGESWKIDSQASPVAGTSALGTPSPALPGAFEAATR